VRFPGIDLETHIEWTDFYLADALIVSGKMTGSPPDRREGETSARGDRKQAPHPHGQRDEREQHCRFPGIRRRCDRRLELKGGDRSENPVDLERVKRYMDAVQKVRDTQAK